MIIKMKGGKRKAPRRIEVYSEKSVTRNGELQPVFVSTDLAKAIDYVRKVTAS